MPVRNKIGLEIRRNIFDALRLESVYFNGALDDDEFLSRIYTLDKLPSYDSRFETAAGDIWQHTVNNDDWEPDWVFSDRRFSLTSCSDEEFLKFLCETIHCPVRDRT